MKRVRAVLVRLGKGFASLPTDLRLLGRGLLLVGSGAPKSTAAYVAIVLLLALLPVLQVWLTKLLLDARDCRRWRA